jgi:ABC superfamily ATP binding cassette transporter, ABC protein
MKQRLGIAMALVRRPRLLILDEPTNGLDPAGIEEIRDLLQRLAERGTTVMVSSHLLGEIDKTATVLGVLAQGRLVFQGNRSEMLDVTAPDILIDCAAPSRACESLSSLSPILEQRSDRALIRLRGITRETTAQAISSLVGRGIDIYSAVPEEQTLESAFMRMTQGGGIR